MADHSPKWHNKEGDGRISNNDSNSLSTITDKLKNLNHDMSDLRENVHKIHPKSNKEFCHEERHDSAIKNLEEKFIRLTHALAVRKVNKEKPVESDIPTPDNSNPVRQECAMKLEPPHETTIQKVETFAKNMKSVSLKIKPTDLSAISITISTGFRFPSPKHLNIENSVTLMLAPKSTRALLTVVLPMTYDVFGGKISLDVGTKQIIFNANEGATPSTISPICVINDYDVIDDFGPEDLEELLMNDDINRDLGHFL
nr:hypothetical protein [Tanacetum cinerariifolium]